METKICGICKLPINTNFFSKNKAKKDGLNSHCKECHKKYWAKHYKENRQHYIDKAKILNQKCARWFKEYKKKYKCVRCGESHPACIQFHHHNKDKLMEVSLLARGYKKETLIKEIEKCTPLCANCHAKEHWID